MSLEHMALYARLLRGSIIQVMDSGYIKAARTKGLTNSPAAADHPHPVQSRQLLIHSQFPEDSASLQGASHDRF